ncbi:NADP-dependent oxidoreductase [Rhodococcus fascians]|uniref:NADP-dependent oxidoreductase n=1 Tax=Rhodococcoides fascians TaxID=1828 RepID=UPI001960640A|nr:NADP-dependent oxidoreductase [Rhodococcus fascians]MBM7246160.1 NADP-dependent oxidoreductase [Rhodococcus fascians]MBY3811914.1 NADP-dependent oxidoreductase [Rhodococcus fascians]MBY3843607.1 NADP-dependent oxidoreductase [Rhodococcus fascians]MBY3848549.1 NADP-dependent oxidoreductase [Rhodococcus fascians]MBY3853143.1 NADP-dependent oxidoreductase [Rhodococcus fascians]
MIAYGFDEYGGPDTETFLDLPVTEPGSGQLLVAVHAAGVNPADWKVRAGNRKDTVQITLPAVLGREVSGTVVRVGAGVDGFSVGDEVFGATASGHGGYAQYTLLNAAGTAHKPEAVSRSVAATLPVAAGTAFDALRGLALTAGNTVLVLGAGGGVGSSVLQLARADGIDVLGVASSGKREWIESLGAEFVESGPEYVGSISRPVHGIVDLVGGDTLRAAAVKTGAPIVSVADPVLAAQWGGSGAVRERTTAAFTRLADLVVTGVLRPRIDHTFPLDRAGEALALVENGHALGKVVIEVR